METETCFAHQEHHDGERGAGVVEWLGISALSVALLVGLFASLTTVGDALIASIRGSLGL